MMGPLLTVLAGEDAPAARKPEARWMPTSNFQTKKPRSFWERLFAPKRRVARGSGKLMAPKAAARNPGNLSGMVGGSAISRYVTRK